MKENQFKNKIFTDLWSSISLISETGSLKNTGNGVGSEIEKKIPFS